MFRSWHDITWYIFITLKNILKNIIIKLYKKIFLDNSANPTVAELFKGIPCSVCTAASSGYHFGAVTCEGCKVKKNLFVLIKPKNKIEKKT